MVSCSGTVCLSTGTTSARALASPDDLFPRKCLPVCSAFVLKQEKKSQSFSVENSCVLKLETAPRAKKK
jgi:hypothetical protein